MISQSRSSSSSSVLSVMSSSSAAPLSTLLVILIIITTTFLVTTNDFSSSIFVAALDASDCTATYTLTNSHAINNHLTLSAAMGFKDCIFIGPDVTMSSLSITAQLTSLKILRISGVTFTGNTMSTSTHSAIRITNKLQISHSFEITNNTFIDTDLTTFTSPSFLHFETDFRMERNSTIPGPFNVTIADNRVEVGTSGLVTDTIHLRFMRVLGEFQLGDYTDGFFPLRIERNTFDFNSKVETDENFKVRFIQFSAIIGKDRVLGNDTVISENKMVGTLEGPTTANTVDNIFYFLELPDAIGNMSIYDNFVNVSQDVATTNGVTRLMTASLLRLDIDLDPSAIIKGMLPWGQMPPTVRVWNNTYILKSKWSGTNPGTMGLHVCNMISLGRKFVPVVMLIENNTFDFELYNGLGERHTRLLVTDLANEPTTYPENYNASLFVTGNRIDIFSDTEFTKTAQTQDKVIFIDEARGDFSNYIIANNTFNITNGHYKEKPLYRMLVVAELANDTMLVPPSFSITDNIFILRYTYSQAQLESQDNSHVSAGNEAIIGFEMTISTMTSFELSRNTMTISAAMGANGTEAIYIHADNVATAHRLGLAKLESVSNSVTITKSNANIILCDNELKFDSHIAMQKKKDPPSIFIVTFMNDFASYPNDDQLLPPDRSLTMNVSGNTLSLEKGVSGQLTASAKAGIFFFTSSFEKSLTSVVVNNNSLLLNTESDLIAEKYLEACPYIWYMGSGGGNITNVSSLTFDSNTITGRFNFTNRSFSGADLVDSFSCHAFYLSNLHNVSQVEFSSNIVDVSNSIFDVVFKSFLMIELRGVYDGSLFGDHDDTASSSSSEAPLLVRSNTFNLFTTNVVIGDTVELSTGFVMFLIRDMNSSSSSSLASSTIHLDQNLLNLNIKNTAMDAAVVFFIGNIDLPNNVMEQFNIVVTDCRALISGTIVRQGGIALFALPSLSVQNLTFAKSLVRCWDTPVCRTSVLNVTEHLNVSNINMTDNRLNNRFDLASSTELAAARPPSLHSFIFINQITSSWPTLDDPTRISNITGRFILDENSVFCSDLNVSDKDSNIDAGWLLLSQSYRLYSSIELSNNIIKIDDATSVGNIAVSGFRYQDGTMSSLKSFYSGSSSALLSSSSDSIVIQNIADYAELTAYIFDLGPTRTNISDFHVDNASVTLVNATMSRERDLITLAVVNIASDGSTPRFLFTSSMIIRNSRISTSFSNFSQYRVDFPVASPNENPRVLLYLLYHYAETPGNSLDEFPGNYLLVENSFIRSEVAYSNYFNQFWSFGLFIKELVRNITVRNCHTLTTLDEFNSTLPESVASLPTEGLLVNLIVFTQGGPRIALTIADSSSSVLVKKSYGHVLLINSAVSGVRVDEVGTPSTPGLNISIANSSAISRVLIHQYSPSLVGPFAPSTDVDQVYTCRSTVASVRLLSASDPIQDTISIVDSNALVEFVDASNHTGDKQRPASSTSASDADSNALDSQILHFDTSFAHQGRPTFNLSNNNNKLLFSWGRHAAAPQTLYLLLSQLLIVSKNALVAVDALNVTDSNNNLTVSFTDDTYLAQSAVFSPNLVENVFVKIIGEPITGQINPTIFTIGTASPTTPSSFRFLRNTIDHNIAENGTNLNFNLKLSNNVNTTPIVSLFNIRNDPSKIFSNLDFASANTLLFRVALVLGENTLTCSARKQTTCGQMSMITSPYDAPAKELLGSDFSALIRGNEFSQPNLVASAFAPQSLEGVSILAMKNGIETNGAAFTIQCNEWSKSFSEQQTANFSSDYNATAEVSCVPSETKTESESETTTRFASLSSSFAASITSTPSMSKEQKEPTETHSYSSTKEHTETPIPPTTTTLTNASTTVTNTSTSTTITNTSTTSSTTETTSTTTSSTTTSTTSSLPPNTTLLVPEEEEEEEIANANSIVEGAGAVSAVAAIASAPSVIRGLTVLSLVADNCKKSKSLQNSNLILNGNGSLVPAPREPVPNLPFPQTIAPFIRIGDDYDVRTPHRGAVLANAILAPLFAVMISIALWAFFFVAKKETDGLTLKKLIGASSLLGRIVQCYGFSIEGSFASATFLFKYTDPDGTAAGGLDVFLALVGFFVPLIALPLLFYRAHSRVLRNQSGEARFEAAKMEVGTELVDLSSAKGMFWGFVLGAYAWRAPPPPMVALPSADSINSNTSSNSSNESIDNLRFEFDLCLPMFGKSRGPVHKMVNTDEKGKDAETEKNTKNKSSSSLTQILGMISARSMLFDILITGFLGVARGYALSDPCTRSKTSLGGMQFLVTLALLETVILRGFISPLRNILDFLSTLTLFLSTIFALASLNEAVGVIATISVAFGILSALLHRFFAVLARFCFSIRLIPESDYEELKSSNDTGDKSEKKNTNDKELMHLLQSAIFSDAPIQRNAATKPKQQEEPAYTPPSAVVDIEDEIVLDLNDDHHQNNNNNNTVNDDFGEFEIDLSDLIDDNMKQAEADAQKIMIDRTHQQEREDDYQDQHQEAEEMIPLDQFDLFDGLDGNQNDDGYNNNNHNRNDDDHYEIDIMAELGGNDDNTDGNSNGVRIKDVTDIVGAETEGYKAPTDEESRLKRLLDELDDEEEDQIRLRKEEEERLRRKRAASSKQSADEILKMLQEALKGKI